MKNKIIQNETLHSAAEDLFVELFCDVFGIYQKENFSRGY